MSPWPMGESFPALAELGCPPTGRRAHPVVKRTRNTGAEGVFIWVQFFLSWGISGLTGCFLLRAPEKTARPQPDGRLQGRHSATARALQDPAPVGCFLLRAREDS